MSRKGEAKLTAHIHVVIEPETAALFKDRAQELGVDASVIYRWALREYAQDKLKENSGSE